MNNTLQCYHPKLSYLLFKYKEFLINVYKKIKSSLVINNIPKNNKKFSVIDDIFEFIKNIILNTNQILILI